MNARRNDAAQIVLNQFQSSANRWRNYAFAQCKIHSHFFMKIIKRIKTITWILLLKTKLNYCTLLSVVELLWIEFLDTLHAKAKSWIHFEYMEIFFCTQINVVSRQVVLCCAGILLVKTLKLSVFIIFQASMGQLKTLLGIILNPLQRFIYIVKHTPWKSDSLQPVVMVNECYATTRIDC